MMSISSPLRIAIIGYGVAGAFFHAPLIAATAGMVVTAIVTSNPDRQKQAQRDFPEATILSSADAIWQNPGSYDAVVIATPNRFHLPLGLAAMEAGLAVVIDKPMAVSVADADQLIAASKRTGQLLTVFQNRRWDNDFLTVKRLINDAPELLGKIIRFESRFERYRPTPRWGSWREQAHPDEGGGVLFDLGSHLIDQALQLFGQPLSVYAEINKRRAEVTVDDDTFVALEFSHGVNAHLWMSTVVPIPGPRMRISGLCGAYEKWGLDPQEDWLRAGLRPGDRGWGMELKEHRGKLMTHANGVILDSPVEMVPGSYEQFYVLLREALLTGSPPPVNPEEALSSLKVIAAAQQSALEKTVVKLA